jgi:hypothetical protein
MVLFRKTGGALHMIVELLAKKNSKKPDLGSG